MAVISTFTNLDGTTYDLKDKNAYGKVYALTLSTSWSGDGPYTQAVSISGVTVSSSVKPDLYADSTVILQMQNDGTEQIYIVNNGGTLTAYAIGNKPTAALSVNLVLTEVT